jgi:hypothetical protein
MVGGSGRARRSLGRIAVCVALALVACDSADEEWDAAESAGTAAAYTRFIEAHPDHHYAKIARIRIGLLEEEGEWTGALAQGSRDGYLAFLERWPRGRYAARAIVAVESLTTSTVTLSEPRRATLTGMVWIGGDTLFARETNTGREVRLRKYMLERIEIDWTYDETPVVLALDPTMDSTAMPPVLNRLAATPSAMRIRLRDGRTIEIQPNTVRPRRLELDTRQTVLGSSREGEPKRLRLRLAPFRQIYGTRVELSDSLRLAAETIGFGPGR